MFFKGVLIGVMKALTFKCNAVFLIKFKLIFMQKGPCVLDVLETLEYACRRHGILTSLRIHLVLFPLFFCFLTSKAKKVEERERKCERETACGARRR